MRIMHFSGSCLQEQQHTAIHGSEKVQVELKKKLSNFLTILPFLANKSLQHVFNFFEDIFATAKFFDNFWAQKLIMLTMSLVLIAFHYSTKNVFLNAPKDPQMAPPVTR